MYVLRVAFAYSHREIAGVLDLTGASARQLYRRAAQRLAAPERRFSPRPEQQRALVESFMAEARDGDLTRLEQLLAKDVVWSGDGGGRVVSAGRPIVGRERALTFLRGVTRRVTAALESAVAEVNGAPGLLVHEGPRLIAVASFEVRDGEIAEVRAVVNPDKLVYVTRQLAGGRR
ncbi:nuclear transport factor 2 family protein [Streptomyces sp. TS71-3]|uniref:nuclear transport factor 2 family protein n=1 Tax=Streptomyces sp. TS71-3 TaxID=2733862 RepID=UPI001BB3D5E3|nr:nuclear transport factor 2 family protein [Streptomyces sp. TS71-3]